MMNWLLSQKKNLFVRKGLTLAGIQQVSMNAILKVTKGNPAEASRFIGINRRTLSKREGAE
jgi:DNA-binding protein Fis